MYYVWYVLGFFWPQGLWDLSCLAQDGTCAPLSLEGNVLTTGPPEKTQDFLSRATRLCMSPDHFLQGLPLLTLLDVVGHT